MPLFGRNKTGLTSSKAIYERHKELLSRPADEKYLNDPTYRQILNDLIRDMFGPNTIVPPDNRHAMLTDLIIVLRMAFSDEEDNLSPRDKQDLRALQTRIPIPTDDELFAFYRTHIPNYDDIFAATVEKWRRETIAQNT